VSVHVAFDIYPAATPNGSLLVRLLASGTGTKQAVELSARKVLHGSGEGMIRIHSSHAAATSANFTKRNYVKVVLVNGATETEWFGFFMEQGDFGAISRREQAGRMLTFSGPGSLFYLDRALLLAEIYAPGQPRRGNLELEGQWGWNDIPYGAIMTRAMEEGYYAPGNPLFYATWDFSRTEDSAAVAWPNIDNEFTVPWGTSVYDLIASFIKLGLVVTVDADLTFHAWQTYGTNRTSGTFAANKIRFAHGVNIGNEVTRQIRASLERSHIFVVGDEFTSAVVSGGSSAVTYYDTLQKQETNDGATLTAAGTRDLTQREIQADAAFPVRVILDDDELNGLYVPGEHYDVGDIATIHTVPPSGASGEHDFTNFAIEVAAIKVEHDDAGNWFAVNELGAQYLSAQLSALEVSSGKVVHQIELCRPEIPGVAIRVDAASSETPDGTSKHFGDAFEVPSGLTDSVLFLVVSKLHTFHPFPNTTPPIWDPDVGATQGSTLYDYFEHGTSSGLALYYILNPNPGPGVFQADNLNSFIGGWLFENVNTATPIAAWAEATGTGTTASVSLAEVASAAYINAMGTDDDDFASDTPGQPSAVAGNTEDWSDVWELPGPGFRDMLFAGGHGDASPSWTFDQSHPWSMFVARINGTGGNDGDGPPELVGSSIRAARCDHNHLAESLLTASTDTTLVLAPDGAGGVEFRAESGGVDLSAIDFLVGTASGDLSNEIAVGTTPGGELGNTWASPTVDATHSGSAHTDFIAKAIVDAKGDLIVATAADTVARRAVGTDGQVLTADSAQATGVTWTTPSVAADLDDLTDVTITAPATDDDLRYNGAQWVNDPRKWEAVTNGENVFVWEGDDLVHEWNEAP
jgi:hypothetical protein